MPIPSILGLAFGSAFFLAAVGIPLLLSLYSLIKAFLTRGRNSKRPFDKYVELIYPIEGDDDDLFFVFMLGAFYCLASVVVGFVGALVGEVYLKVGLYILTPVAIVAGLFLLRFLFDVAYGLKHNKDTGKLEEIDKLRKKIEKLERGEAKHE